MSSLSLAPELEKLKSVAPDKQSLFLFNSFSTHYHNLALLDASLLSPQSSTLLDDLIVALRAPGLHRAHRNLLGRCFVTILRKVDRGPFEVTNKLISFVSKERDEKFKWAAVAVLGQIFENVGSEIVSLVGELVVILSKIIKSNSNPPGIRAAALRTLSAALGQVHKLDESVQKEVLKVLRGCLPDKSTVVHAAAYEVSISPCVVSC